MEKLNRLDWADGLSVTAFGFRIGIRTNAPAFLPELLDRLPPGWKLSRTQRVQWLLSLHARASRANPDKTFHQLHSGSDLVTRGTNFPRIVEAFGNEVRAILALRSPCRSFVHAGSVGWKGRAIVLPGHAGAGKSTLTRALVRAGASYYSDEFAVLDRKGRVFPYPLPLREKTGSGPASVVVPPQELGGSVGTRALPVGLILSTRFDPTREGRLQRLSSGRGALELMAHAVQARLRPQAVMESVGTAAAGAIILKGPRGEAEKIVDTILGLW